MLPRLAANLIAFYGPSAPGRLVGLYRLSQGPAHFLIRYWNTQRFSELPAEKSADYRPVRWLLAAGMLAQAVFGVALGIRGVSGDHLAGALIGAGIILAAPIIWTHLFFVAALGWRALRIKHYAKVWLCQKLEAQVRTLREANDFSLIAVAGSIGKTSTKLAIARTLEAAGKRVQYQEGNYNDRLTVPLVIFGQSQPALYNPLAWWKVWRHNQRMLKQAYPFDVVVVELGIDGPGQMRDFAYLSPELAVVTAVAEEHMAFFGSLDVVAREELWVFNFAKQVLLNTDDVAAEYVEKDRYDDYGLGKQTYRGQQFGKLTGKGQKVRLNLDGETFDVQSIMLGQQGAKALVAAGAVAHLLGLHKDAIGPALASLEPFAGRMQLLEGKQHSVLIDDTYNASPRATTAALDVLYSMDAPQRIAILGSMNEMGELSPALHREVGAYCDPSKLDLVITVGADAEAFLAPAAKLAGCDVKSYRNPRKAGAYAVKHLKDHAIVLAKGSQNGVFAEEALKPLLNVPADASRLVRQSAAWLKIKHRQFGD